MSHGALCAKETVCAFSLQKLIKHRLGQACLIFHRFPFKKKFKHRKLEIEKEFFRTWRGWESCVLSCIQNLLKTPGFLR